MVHFPAMLILSAGQKNFVEPSVSLLSVAMITLDISCLVCSFHIECGIWYCWWKKFRYPPGMYEHPANSGINYLLCEYNWFSRISSSRSILNDSQCLSHPPENNLMSPTVELGYLYSNQSRDSLGDESLRHYEGIMKPSTMDSHGFFYFAQMGQMVFCCKQTYFQEMVQLHQEVGVVLGMVSWWNSKQAVFFTQNTLNVVIF